MPHHLRITCAGNTIIERHLISRDILATLGAARRMDHPYVVEWTFQARRFAFLRCILGSYSM
jgi:hypothetical protein